MSLQAIAEDLVVLEPMNSQDHGAFLPEMHADLSDHYHDSAIQQHDHMEQMPSLLINQPKQITIVVEDIPGAPSDLPEILEEIEVQEPEEHLVVKDDEHTSKKEDGKDENDAKKSSKKSDKWDWESKGAEGFVHWVKERLETVPRHSGMDTAGLERAISYLEKLDGEISKAMRLDLEGDLDADKIEEIRSKIDDGLSRLSERLDKVKKTKKNYKKKKADSDIESTGLVKEAQKITGVQGIYVTVPLLVSRIARVCINGMVSAGHDIEDLYNRQVKYYKLSNREQAEVMQLLSDMGYPMRQDRGFMPEDALEVSDSNGMDWASSYKA
jgi:hypothetical protein